MEEVLKNGAEAADDTLKNRVLTFVIDNQFYGIELKNVIEIIGVQPITVVPGIPPYLKGIINLRGKVITVMDVRMKFDKPEKPFDERTCIIVVEVNDFTVGLIVDMVDEVINLTEENLAVTPNFNRVNANRYIKAIGKLGDQVRLIIDCDKLLNDNEHEPVAIA